MMKKKKIFERATEKGIEQLQIISRKKEMINLKMFNDFIEKYKTSNITTYLLKGIVDEKIGICKTETLSNNLIDDILDSIIESATFKDDELEDIYNDEEKIRYKEKFPDINIEDQIDRFKKVYTDLKEYDNHIIGIESYFTVNKTSVRIENNNGLDKLDDQLKYSYYISVAATDGEKMLMKTLYHLQNKI